MEADELEMANLNKAIYEDNWFEAKAFIDRHPKLLDVDFGASRGETPLHTAAKFGHVAIVEELMKLVEPEYLEIWDYYGYTPLATTATHTESIPIAKCMIKKNSNALAIPAPWPWLIPVTLAFLSGHNKLGRYLYSVTPLEVFKPENGSFVGPEFLRTCLRNGEYGIALQLLQQCTELLFAQDADENSTIANIALSLPHSLHKSQLPFLKRWAYHYIKIPPTTTTGHFYVDIQQEGEGSRAGQGTGLRHWLLSSVYNLSGMKEIYKMKLQHAQATEILNLLCPNILMLLNVEKRNMIRIALNCAAQQDNAEFVLRVTKANPELIALVTSVCLNYPVFVITAVEYRKAAVFSLFLCRHFQIMAAATPAKMRAARETGNNLLHLAASLAPDSYLNSISGAALQMQRELQWFKAVESVVDPGYRLHQNKEGLIPIEYFKKNHKGLRAEGEKWMKDTASSCSVVGTLIVTIMFTAALTVPGGNNQDSGYPMFIKEKLFKVFLISDALSLFSSTTSVLVFLGILTSRYAEEDFLCSLPTKLIIGLSTLFLSIATMMISFSATIMIMLQYNSLRLWVTLPITMLAGVPVTLFILLQFPLLVKVFSSTYGPSIFKKKVEEWS